MTEIYRASIRKPNSVGLVLSTAGPDLVHTLGISRSGIPRTAIIRKIMAYNNTGADVLLQFGTVDAVPAFVQYLPDLLAVNGLDSEWGETDIPVVEFSLVNQVGVAFRAGNIWLQSNDVGVLVIIEVEEFGF
jgi:hypothetical protein